jgi:hypothetical protein
MMILGTMILRLMTFGKMTLCTMTFGKITFSIMTLSITTLSIMTLAIMTLSQHYDTKLIKANNKSLLCRVALYCVIILSDVRLNVVEH